MRYNTVHLALVLSFSIIGGVIATSPLINPGIAPDNGAVLGSPVGGLNGILGFLSSCPSGGIDGLLSGLLQGFYQLLCSLLGCQNIIPLYGVLGQIPIDIDLISFLGGGPDLTTPFVNQYSKIQLIQILIEVARIYNGGKGVGILGGIGGLGGVGGSTTGVSGLLNNILGLLGGSPCGGLDGLLTGLGNGINQLLSSLLGLDKLTLLSTSLAQIPTDIDLLTYVGGGADWTSPLDVPCQCTKLQSLQILIKLTQIISAGPLGLSAGCVGGGLSNGLAGPIGNTGIIGGGLTSGIAPGLGTGGIANPGGIIGGGLPGGIAPGLGAGGIGNPGGIISGGLPGGIAPGLGAGAIGSPGGIIGGGISGGIAPGLGVGGIGNSAGIIGGGLPGGIAPGLGAGAIGSPGGIIAGGLPGGIAPGLGAGAIGNPGGLIGGGIAPGLGIASLGGSSGLIGGGLGGILDGVIGLVSGGPCGGLDGLLTGLAQGINQLLCSLLGCDNIYPLLNYLGQIPPDVDLLSYLGGSPAWTVPIVGQVTQLQCALFLIQLAKVYPAPIGAVAVSSGGGLGGLVGGLLSAVGGLVDGLLDGILGLLSGCPSGGLDGLLSGLATGINQLLCSLLGCDNVILFYNALNQLPTDLDLLAALGGGAGWTTPIDGLLTKLQWFQLMIQWAGICNAGPIALIG